MMYALCAKASWTISITAFWGAIGAVSGEEALAILETESPQGAIVDIRLGGMDGKAFIREAYRKQPKMAFVICTGSPEYDIPADVRKLPGISDRVFTKPVANLADLEEDLLRLITKIESKEAKSMGIRQLFDKPLRLESLAVSVRKALTGVDS